MQVAVAIVFFGVLAFAMAFFAVMGLVQARRTRELASAAYDMGLRFSPDDLFDVPRRYGDMALMSCGHSPRANNVAHGRLAGMPVQAFDFRYEAGHGPRRMTRHYSVIVAEAQRELPRALIWHVEDEEFGPLAVRRPDMRVGCWHCVGDAAFARKLAEACRPLADLGVSAETLGPRILLCSRVERGGLSRALPMAAAIGVLQAVKADGPD